MSVNRADHRRRPARRARRVCAAALPAALLLLLGPDPASATPIVLENELTRLTINGGEATSGLLEYSGYFQYTDRTAGPDGDPEFETTYSVGSVLRFDEDETEVLSEGRSGGFGSPVAIGGGKVQSTAFATDDRNRVEVKVVATTELIGRNAITNYSFDLVRGNSLDGLQFLFYADSDLFDADDDVAGFTGSLAGGDLGLFQFENSAGGLTVKLEGKGVSNSALSLFGSGAYPDFGDTLEDGYFDAGEGGRLSADGSALVEGPDDLGLALAFDLWGTSAELTVNYRTQTSEPGEIPEDPLLPTVVTDDGFVFTFGTRPEPVFIDPPFATGYEYSVISGPNFATVEIPGALPGGDGMFTIVLPDGTTIPLVAGAGAVDLLPYSINDAGFDTFSIIDIDAGEMLDPTDPTAFVAGLTFVVPNVDVTVSQNPITGDAPVPAPASMLLAALGAGAVSCRRRRGTRAKAPAPGGG